jgi:diguanylate cyclase (GGDEF)-like protein
VGTDIYIECSVAAERMGEALRGRGKVALVGVVDPYNAEAEIKNRMFLAQLTNHYAGIEAVAVTGARKWEIKERAYELARTLLERHPNLSGIYCNADEALAPIVRALSDAGRAGQVCVVGYGNEPAAMELLSNGSLSFAILHNRFAYGHDSVVYLYNKLVALADPPAGRILVMPEVVSRDDFLEVWDPEEGYLLTEKMRRALARPVEDEPTRPLRIAILLEGIGPWFDSVIEGARAAERALPNLSVDVRNWEISGFSQEAVDQRNADELAKVVEEGYDGAVMWILNESVVEPIQRAVASGLKVVVFHTEPVTYEYITPEVDEVFSSLYRQLRMREVAERKLLRLSHEDELTGLDNRRRFTRYGEEDFPSLVRQAQRRPLELSVMMVDIDEFKRLNDRFGHFVGDRCLKAVADEIRAALRRQSDFAARYGGEEFVVVLPSTGVEEARLVADRIRQSIQALTVHSRGEHIPITVSIGVASLSVSGETSPAAWGELMDRADAALYCAKREGRNRVKLG